MSTINGGKGPITMHAPGTAQAPPTQSGLPAQQEAGAKQLAPGQSPKTTAENVTKDLKGKGFEAPPAAPKDLASQLAGALKEFQKQAGLPQTGLLGGKTNDALKNIGVAGQAAEQPSTTKQAKDDFERGAPSLLKQGEKGRADVAKNSTPDTNFLDALLNKLGGDSGVTADKQGTVGGSQHTDTAKTDGPKEAKKVQETGDKSGSTEGKKEAKEATQQQLDKAKQEQKVQVARGLKAEQAKTEEQKRNQALFGKNPTEKGILEEEEEDEEATEGDGGKDGKKKGRGGDQHGGGHDASASDTAGAAGERDGNEKSKGNAHSGAAHDDGDPSRGHASVDDGSGAEAGHYRVATLSEQAFAALGKIQKDPAQANKATTYSWDVMFFKPGVYSPGQKAQDLVHLVVQNATPFDPVWQKAQANLQALVRRVEKDGAVPTLEDIIAALRQARAKDGAKDGLEPNPPSFGKLQRPPGRA